MKTNVSFEYILSILYSNPKKYKYYLESSKFSQTQKKLLKAHAAFKAEERDHVFELLRNKKFQNLFEEGLRCYFLAATFNRFGHLRFAQEHYIKAEKAFIACNNTQYQFYCLCDLFFLHSNLKTFKKIDSRVKELEKVKTKNNHDQLLKNYALALHYFNMRQEKKALKLIDKSLQYKCQFGKLFKNPLLMTLFRIQLRQGSFDQCYKTLEKYKKAKGLTVDVNYKYIKFLLDFIVHDSPLYIYARNFKHNPEIFGQLQCIDFLSRNQQEEALKVWKSLQKHNPDIYQDHFHFPEDDSLFSLALRKALEMNSQPDGFELSEVDNISKTIEKLDYILKYFPHSITKAKLIEFLWHEDVDEKSLKKLSRLMMKYKKMKGIQIKSYQETYKISA